MTILITGATGNTARERAHALEVFGVVRWIKGVAMTTTISRDELKQKIDRKDDFFLVEILPPTAYHHAHLPGAINLPPDRVTSDALKLIPNKSAEIVVYCASPT